MNLSKFKILVQMSGGKDQTSHFIFLQFLSFLSNNYWKSQEKKLDHQKVGFCFITFLIQSWKINFRQSIKKTMNKQKKRWRRDLRRQKPVRNLNYPSRFSGFISVKWWIIFTLFGETKLENLNQFNLLHDEQKKRPKMQKTAAVEDYYFRPKWK